MNSASARSFGRLPRGYSLLEIIVVIGVIGLMVAAVAWGINKAFGSNATKDEIKAVTHVLAVLPELRSQNSYGANGESLVPPLIARNDIPAVWRNSAGTLKNSWGDNVLVRSYGSFGQFARITSSSIPNAACNKLVVKISINSTIKQTQINSGTVHPGEVTAAQAAVECTTGTNRIDWYTVH